MAILVDFNQIIIAMIHVASKDYGANITVSDIRNLVLRRMLYFKKKFGAEYGELVICCDSGASWRRDAFAYYKEGRAKSRAESPLDWKFVFQALAEIQQEIREYLPWKIVSSPKAEGDDIVAILTKYYQQNELTGQIYQEPQKVLIVSTDGDFIQLQKYQNVKQYNHITNMLVKSANPTEDRIDKIIRGDRGDGIPNIMSPDDTFVSDGRQVRMTLGRYAKLRESVDTGIWEKPEYEEGFKRNLKLIDLLESIPSEIEESVLEAYTNAPSQKGSLHSYLIKHRLKTLMEEIHNF